MSKAAEVSFQSMTKHSFYIFFILVGNRLMQKVVKVIALRAKNYLG